MKYCITENGKIKSYHETLKDACDERQTLLTLYVVRRRIGEMRFDRAQTREMKNEYMKEIEEYTSKINSLDIKTISE